MRPWFWFCTLLSMAYPAFADVIFADDGRAVTRTEVIDAMLKSDFILLGEQHDNPHHHRLRSELIAELAALGNGVAALAAGTGSGRNATAATRVHQPTLVMEYLDRGTRLNPERPLLEEMERAGFNAQGWHWPLHEPLFTVARAAGLNILGGNLKRDDARRIVMQGEAAVEAGLAGQLARTPLSSLAQQRLDDALNAGHCGQLPASRLANMRLAQRARDAAMTASMLDTGGGPVILLAGNGHVRADFGVTASLRQLAPDRNHISIGFFEDDSHWERRLIELRGVYDFVWITPSAQREDACAGFKLPIGPS